MGTQGAAPQHLVALARANTIRFARAELKREVGRGEVTVGELLRSGMPANTASIPVAELLAAQRRWGDTRTRKLLAKVAISEKRPVGNLTARERRALIDALNGEVRDRRLLAA